MSSLVWIHYHKATERYKENRSRWEARCRYCVDARVREIRTKELDDVVDNLRTEAQSEEDIRTEVLCSMDPICGKVETLWRHLAKECPHAPLDIQQSARQEQVERQKARADKENARIQAISSTASVPLMPARQTPLAHSRTGSLDSIITNGPASPTGTNEPPTKRLRPAMPGSVDPGVFYGETVPVARFPESMQADFAADLCRLMVVSNIAWYQVEQPYWRAFFQKWLPEVLMPGRRELSGCILNEEAEKVEDRMKKKIQNKYATGQNDGWKNITKTALVASMMNVEYVAYLINTYDISALPKTAENLLEIVLSEIKYCVEILRLIVVAWCTDASGESAKMRRLLVRAHPYMVVLDCWCHQVNLVVGDVFKVKDLFTSWIDDALEVIKWFNSHSRALGLLQEAQRTKFGKVLCLILPVLTRWTSHYLSVHRLLELEIAFKQLLLDSTPDLLLCAGNKTEAKQKAAGVIGILERYDFWANLRKIQAHLEPLAIAANATQADCARLDVVLLTLANLYRVYSDTSLDEQVCAAVLKSLEKRWANADQPIFILAVVFNPYLRTLPFATNSPYRSFNQLWSIAKAAFQRMYNVKPDAELRRAFNEYLMQVGEWSDDAMELEFRKELARRTKQPVNLLDIWREYDSIPESHGNPPFDLPPKNGKAGLASLAMRILSMVPNSAATERIFSQFGIVHTKHRNRLHPDKVRKQVLLKTDTVARFGMPPNQKRKFEHVAIDDESAGVHAPSACESAEPSNSGPSDENLHSHLFLPVARELMDASVEADLFADASSYIFPSVLTTPASVLASNPAAAPSFSAKDHLLLKNLFNYPVSSSNNSFSSSLSILTDFWRSSEQGFEAELAFHDIIQA